MVKSHGNRVQAVLVRCLALAMLICLAVPAVATTSFDPAAIPEPSEIDFRVLLDDDRAAADLDARPPSDSNDVDLLFLDVRPFFLDEDGLLVRIGFSPPRTHGYQHEIIVEARMGAQKHSFTLAGAQGLYQSDDVDAIWQPIAGANGTTLDFFVSYERLDIMPGRLSWAWNVHVSYVNGDGDVMPGTYHVPGGGLAPQANGQGFQRNHLLQAPPQLFALGTTTGHIDPWLDGGSMRIQVFNPLATLGQRIALDLIDPATLPFQAAHFDVAPGQEVSLGAVLGLPADIAASNVSLRADSSLGSRAELTVPILRTLPATGNDMDLAPMQAAAFALEPGAWTIGPEPDNGLHIVVAEADGKARPVTLYWQEQGGAVQAYAERLDIDADDLVRVANLGSVPMHVGIHQEEADHLGGQGPSPWWGALGLAPLLAGLAMMLRRPATKLK